jgi:hypothetical protein
MLQLKQQYNPAGRSNGMLNLLNHNNNGPQENMTATAADVLRALKKEANKESAQKGTTVTPKITVRSSAQDKADRRNIINQALIGSKEGWHQHHRHGSRAMQDMSSCTVQTTHTVIDFIKLHRFLTCRTMAYVMRRT